MKLNSSPVRRSRPLAATLFLAGAVAFDQLDSGECPMGKCMAERLQGQSACKGAANSCKGQNSARHGFLDDLREAVAWRSVAST